MSSRGVLSHLQRGRIWEGGGESTSCYLLLLLANFTTAASWYLSYFLPHPCQDIWQVCYIRTFNVMSLKDWLAAVLYAPQVIIECSWGLCMISLKPFCRRFLGAQPIELVMICYGLKFLRFS